MLQGITLDLSGGRLSDLYFNFEHPERDKVYQATDPKDLIDEAALDKADQLDATEFAILLDIPEDERDEFVAALVADFRRRI